ncbi:type IV pilin biogenesis protein [Franconibacter daqui]|uniref:protein transport protein HofC n=1 Tax=Franconibacter daqui TaxID=2047724 RepID=UPI0016650466|nr:protein transport protein HofC [Franconibacter daqui]GGD28076.1 type IV pilin biogenesis protein [Franconibacter daqui]
MANQLWRWQGLNNQGERLSGQLWASDRPQALLHLSEAGLHPLSLRKAPVNKRLWRGMHSLPVIRQLATLLQAGVSLTDGLALLAQQQSSAQWRALLEQIAGEVQRGVTLSQAMKAWPDVFTPLAVSLVNTGEMTGKLDICCEKLANQQEEQQRLRQLVGKALRYPVIILIMALAMTLGMAGFVLPQFAAIYASFSTPLPWITRAVIAFSQGLTRYGPVWISAGTLCVAAIIFFRKRPAWRLAEEKMGLKLPLFGLLLRGQKLSQIYTVLTMTQQSGIPLLQGLTSVEMTLSSPFWQATIARIRTKIAQGLPFCQAIEDEAGFSTLCMQMIRTGEETGALDIMLARLAQWHTQQTQQRAETLATSLEPIMMIVIGLIIGTLVIAMYLPLFNLGDAMSGLR